MAYQQKPNSGSLFKADKKSDKAPDYTGNFMDSNGKLWRLAAWVKQGQKGSFFSLSASEITSATKEETGNDLPF